jgi:hypothetical protein
MVLTKIEKEQFVEIKNDIVKLATLDSVDNYDEFYNEDIECRISNIDKLLVLLEREKTMLNGIK